MKTFLHQFLHHLTPYFTRFEAEVNEFSPIFPAPQKVSENLPESYFSIMVVPLVFDRLLLFLVLDLVDY